MKIILITGASGSGTSTLGQAVAEHFAGYTHFDADDFYWQPTDPPYTTARSKGARIDLLNVAVENCQYTVISGCICSWGEPLLPWFELVVRLHVPSEIRIERLKLRERAEFGSRIDPGGDMYQNHLDFLAYAASYDIGTTGRNKALHDKWLKMAPCPVLNLDGTLPTALHLEAIRQKLLRQELRFDEL